MPLIDYGLGVEMFVLILVGIAIVGFLSTVEHLLFCRGSSFPSRSLLAKIFWRLVLLALALAASVLFWRWILPRFG